MSANKIQDGKVLDVTAGAAISAGDVVLIGTRVGIAETDAANGDSLACAVEGVFEVAKKTTDVIAQGDLLYWDASESEMTSTSTDNTLAGYATEAAAGTVSLVKMKINA